ncbi:hypothetical protein G5714_004462 [Onychostoma macrolepis]|uniref:Uncharacterized protein n=1 Tax=Onychostoma macrolepis TaxID=369639 RepID=A0A7J6D4Q9_9TELE|nr:hypothetical protein G5714_004462 [Onychostoma macrolepis]
MLQSSLLNFFSKKPRLDGQLDTRPNPSPDEDVSPSPGPASTGATSLVQLAEEKTAQSEDTEMASTSELKPTNLSAVDEPPCQPKLRDFPVTQTVSGKRRNFSAKWYDRQLMELNNRFQSDSYEIKKAAASLLPRSDAFGQMEILQSSSQSVSSEGQDALEDIEDASEDTGDGGYICPPWNLRYRLYPTDLL